MKLWPLVVLAACGSPPAANKPSTPNPPADTPAPKVAATPHESRLGILQATFEALGAGDVERLIALSGAKAIYEDAQACESTEMETKAVEQRLRNDYRKPAAASKGMKVEVLAVEQLDRDDEHSVAIGKRVQGCTARVDVDMHIAKVKVRVSKDAEQAEAVVRVGLVEVGDRWYVNKVPAVSATNRWKPIVDKLRGFADRMCKCKDSACTEQVSNEYYAWIREISSTFRDDEDRPPDEVMKEATEVSERFVKCQMAAEQGGNP